MSKCHEPFATSARSLKGQPIWPKLLSLSLAAGFCFLYFFFSGETHVEIPDLIIPQTVETPRTTAKHFNLIANQANQEKPNTWVVHSTLLKAISSFFYCHSATTKLPWETCGLTSIHQLKLWRKWIHITYNYRFIILTINNAYGFSKLLVCEL